jgi:enoyl-CoA hydratase
MANVRFEKRDAIAVVTIDRSGSRNAIDGPTAEELHAAFLRFDEDRALSVAVLQGAGGTFSAGADLRGLAEGRGNRVTDDGPGPLGPTRLLLGKPVIAAIEGHAVAGGLELAAWCDLRVAARDAVLGVFCRRWGVPLIDGGTVRLARLIGGSRALDLVLTGRPVTGEEAAAIGLVNRLTERGGALAGALELAAELAAAPQTCLRSDRLALLEGLGLPHEAAMQNELRRGLEVIASGSVADGVAAYLAGRSSSQKPT